MCTSSIRSFLIGILWFSVSVCAVGQAIPRLMTLNCGTAELTDSQKQTLHRQATAALLRKRPNGVFTSITYVPIRPHIIRRSDGTGGFSTANLNQAMALANKYYLTNGLGIQFYFCGTTPDYIDNDGLHTQFPNPEGSVVDGRNAADALNQFYVNTIQGGRGGYAYFPTDDQPSTRSFIQTYGSSAADYNVEDLGNYVIPHELGHTFNLFHTFGLSNGEGTSSELVTRGAGANCGSAGDLICDTPADPYNIPGANFFYVGNHCLQYDPASTARDANGDVYSPSTSNIMSYYNSCSHDFTPGQYDHIQAGLTLRQSHTSYTLNCPPTAVATPTSVVATVSGSAVVLTWQDNAANEMGYFVERSTSPASGFLPIGGVGPNTITFRDTQFPARTTYYYRVRPSNATTGGLSATASATLPAISGLTTTNISGTSAQLNWSDLGSGVTYVVQWRPVGTTSWNDIPGITAPTYTLQNLFVNTNYEWQVRTSDSPDYAGPVQFSTTCSPPGSPYSTVTRTTAVLYWDSNNNHYQAYNLRYRVVGAANWTDITNYSSSPYYALNSLPAATQYEWQVQGICSPGVVSNYSASQPFTTLACLVPYQAGTSSVGATTAYFYWYDNQYESTKTYEFRYRVVGAANWQVKSGLTSGYLSLTSLTTNTTYEWQLRSQCSATELSDYTDLKTFATVCPVPQTPNVYPTATTAGISWNVNPFEPGQTYTLQYRIVGAANWTTLSGLTSSYYSLTGLTNSVTYECRVQLVCLANDQSAFSAVSTFSTNCTAPTAGSSYAYLLTSTSAQLNWYSPAADASTRYDLHYRVVGATDWITVNNAFTSAYASYTLTGLTNATPYEWQVRTVCSPTQQSAYVAGPNFTTLCSPPPYGYASAQLYTATLSWDKTGVDVLYEVQIRVQGETNWITLNNNSNTFLSMQGLRSGTTYEWQVRTRCSDGVVSNFSAVRTFQTASCSSPYSLQTSYYSITTSSARIQWSFSFANADTRYEARYRVVGAPNWITVTGLSSTNGAGYYDLTGLSASTTYEWQIKTLCSATEQSPFSNSVTFQTLCPGMYTVKAGDWNDPTVWLCNRVPNSYDVVQIKHAVTVPASYVAHALTVRYDAGQTLNFGTNAQLKLGL